MTVSSMTWSANMTKFIQARFAVCLMVICFSSVASADATNALRHANLRACAQGNASFCGQQNNNVIAEPEMLVLLGSGMIVLGMVQRRKSRPDRQDARAKR